MECFQLKLQWGSIPTPCAEVDVPELKPGEEGNVSVDFVSPTQPGKFAWLNFFLNLFMSHFLGTYVTCVFLLFSLTASLPTTATTFLLSSVFPNFL